MLRSTARTLEDSSSHVHGRVCTLSRFFVRTRATVQQVPETGHNAISSPPYAPTQHKISLIRCKTPGNESPPSYNRLIYRNPYSLSPTAISVTRHYTLYEQRFHSPILTHSFSFHLSAPNTAQWHTLKHINSHLPTPAQAAPLLPAARICIRSHTGPISGRHYVHTIGRFEFQISPAVQRLTYSTLSDAHGAYAINVSCLPSTRHQKFLLRCPASRPHMFPSYYPRLSTLIFGSPYFITSTTLIPTRLCLPPSPPPDC